MTDLEKISKIWQLQLNIEYEAPNKNVRLSFKDIGPFCEHLAIDFFPGFVGSGSGGMGLDLSNYQTKKAIEVKSCCTIQNAKCNNCDTKFNSLFLIKCPQCGEVNFEEISDSRFSINAKELLDQYKEGIIENITLCHISLDEKNEKEKEITIYMEWFEINFNDEEIREEQLKYFKNQYELGAKNNCNLLPNSFDFYKLCPQKIYEAKIIINYANINKSPEIIDCELDQDTRLSESTFRFTLHELVLFRKLKSYDKETKTAEVKDFSKNIPYRNKSHGKQRGDTRKNIYKKLNKSK